MRKQIKKFTTDPHLIKQTLSNYSNTFVENYLHVKDSLKIHYWH